MIIGPVFHREVTTLPRRTRLYGMRAAYVGILLVLLATAWQVLAGTQLIRNTGDLARFAAMVFQILAPLQLGVMVFFAALSAASGVAVEKDRQTLLLLLLTNLTNSELVLGKLLASILSVLSMTLAAMPLFMLLAMLGGVSFGQIGEVFAVTFSTVVLAGSLGSTVALWREKTFQSLAMTVLALVSWVAIWEAVHRGAFGATLAGVGCETLAAGFSPWQAILAATRPYTDTDVALGWIGTPINLFLLSSLSLAALANALAIALVRVWNPSREAQSIRPVAQSADEESENELAARKLAPKDIRTREVWDNPILWREVRTWAYGRRTLLIHLAYIVLAGLSAAAIVSMVGGGQRVDADRLALVLAPLGVLSLLLINAQAVTALTSERDAKAIDLLLVTDITPSEFVFGKLGGILYNTKEIVLLPMALAAYLWFAEAIGVDDLVFLSLGWIVMVCFAAMVGVHAGMNYVSSRSAIGVSLGTIFFLFVGVATTMRIMTAFAGSFQIQLQPFVATMVGGGLGLFVAIGNRNPSMAIGFTSFLCPFLTFYAMTSFLLRHNSAVFLTVVGMYGFATAAMLVPAIYEFDVATGRTTAGEGDQ